MTVYPIDTLQHVAMIHIGRQTEAGVERIGFDCSAWLARWPGMELSVWPTAPGADTAYEAQTHMDGNIIVWDVSGSDTITPGNGHVEVLGMVDGRRKLSARVQTMVIASGLAATSDPPESQQPWFERAMQAVDGVPEAINTALQAAKESGEFDGADGISPTVTVEDIDGGHRVTITDKDGDKTFEVMDGAGGGASVQADWSVNDENDPAYVQNRTHWVERAFAPIVWDGSTEGRDSIDVGLAFGEPAGTMIAYKISDTVFDTESLLGSTTSTTIGNETYRDFVHEATDGSVVVPVIPEGFVVFYNYGTMRPTEWGETDFARGLLFVFRQAGDFSSSLGIVIPSTGLYAFMFNPHLFELTGNDIYHKIDSRFLPDVGVSKEYVDTAIELAISEAIAGAIGGSY